MKGEGLKRGYDGNIQGCRLPDRYLQDGSESRG